MAEDVGIRPADLMSLVRLVVFVEGPHDVAVMEEFIGDRLSRAGVLLLPMHGTHGGLTGLIESEVLAALGVTMGVMTDATDAVRVRDGDAQSEEETMVVRLIREARAAGRDLTSFGLRKRDIVEYLSDDSCRQKAPLFPGWDQAVEMWNKAHRPSRFKDWVSTEFGLHLNRASVRSLAATTRLTGRVPKEFIRLAREIESVADERSSVLGYTTDGVRFRPREIGSE